MEYMPDIELVRYLCCLLIHASWSAPIFKLMKRARCGNRNRKARSNSRRYHI